MLFYKYIQTWLFSSFVFVSVFNAHRKAWIIPDISHFRRFDYFANFAVSRQNNLIYDAEEKNGLFAATSATRVIIFAVRPFALFGRVRGKPAAISSHNRVYTVPCSVFLLPCYVSGGFLFLVFIVFIITFCS